MLRDHGETSQADLAATLHVDRTNLVGLLNELEAQGLVERRRSPEDRRRHTVTLTDAGHERLAAVSFALAATEARILQRLDGDERAQLHALLRKAAEGTFAGACDATPPTDC
jgi:DNA-binding MarR family transcriptional regulator